MSSQVSLKFFYHPRACSLAPHIILEELGLPYQRCLVDLRHKENRNEEYLKLNPTGAIPALVIDDITLTETQAILTYLGDLLPGKNILPRPGDQLRYRAHEWMNFMSSSVHVYIRSIFRPEVYGGADEQVNAAVKAQGVANLEKSVAIVEKRLENKTWALGDQFSVADAYLFVMYLWTTDERIPAVPKRPRWDALAERVWKRPAVQRVIAVERQDRDYRVPATWVSKKAKAMRNMGE